MKLFIYILIFILFFLQACPAYSQQIKFNRVLEAAANNWRGISSISQDQLGYLWFGTYSNGFYQYDGTTLNAFTHDANNTNSVSDNGISSLVIDNTGNIWIGTYGSGLNEFNPITNTFTHFRHNPKKISSLASDKILSILQDHLGNIWIATFDSGLDKMDIKTGTISHYAHDEKDPASISFNTVDCIYEDHQGTIWAGCASLPGFGLGKLEHGGLNRFDMATGKFTHYKHSASDSNSLTDNNVTSIYEDSKGYFWIGTGGDGLHTMDRKSGKFTRYPYDPNHPEKLSRPPLAKGKFAVLNLISLIKEDSSGAIWIAGLIEGINRYDPISKKVTHYGNVMERGDYSKKDTVSGFDEPTNNAASVAFASKDGLFWIGTIDGNLYKLSSSSEQIPYYHRNADNNSFFEDGEGILWIATSKGLIRRNIKTGTEKAFLHEPENPNSLSGNNVTVLRPDGDGNFWIGTAESGLNKLDTHKNIFTIYKNIPGDNNSLAGDSIAYSMYIDKSQNLWIGIYNKGLDKFNIKSGKITHYRYDEKDSSGISNKNINCICQDRNRNIWAGTDLGLKRLDQTTNQFHHYLKQSVILSVCIDSTGTVWAGTIDGLYRFNLQKNDFTEYTNPNSQAKIKGVLHILEDDQHNLWIATATAIIKINARRDGVRIFGKNYGVHANTFYVADNYKSKSGELFIGDQSGYYAFFPDQLRDAYPPKVNFTAFKMGDAEILAASGSVLNNPIWNTKEIKLNYKQNTFSFDFKAIDYRNLGEIKYLFMLQNYDNNWHDLETDHKAYFFNVPPGTYTFRIKAINSEGANDEKAISIIITPPWWRTWWAYTIFALLIAGSIRGFILYRSRRLMHENRALEEKVLHRTEQLNKSLENLKAAQTQLIQSEKMASLGELTAGIAHEIQNPLNFVNNFSEVNIELIEEMKTELRAGNNEEAIAIADDIKENEEKIKHHGKRADAIVKGMLQHSQGSSGLKEPTDINKLADEYLRLSYHGLRNKDKNFNATMKTEFDQTIGKINIVPQDVGRVLLNLYNNAFYAIAEKKKQQPEGYEPTVSLSTKKDGDKIFVSVKDNGKGIAQKIVDKIFQPFFTTKPTGQGTGLGLSLAYDIIKAHGGEIKVETKEGEGSEFIIQLPV